jgi:hypothetical protein
MPKKPTTKSAPPKATDASQVFDVFDFDSIPKQPAAVRTSQSLLTSLKDTKPVPDHPTPPNVRFRETQPHRKPGLSIAVPPTSAGAFLKRHAEPASSAAKRSAVQKPDAQSSSPPRHRPAVGRDHTESVAEAAAKAAAISEQLKSAAGQSVMTARELSEMAKDCLRLIGISWDTVLLL